MPVTNGGCWFVADGVSCFVESPDEIDVLTHGEVFIETADGVEEVNATDERGRRNVGDARPCTDPAALCTAIERCMDSFVPSKQWMFRNPERFDRRNARRGDRHFRIAELIEQWSQPSRSR